MKALRTLLKVAKRDLETLRRALAEQIQRETLIEDRMHGHEQAIRAEQQHAAKDYEAQRAYGGFAQVAIQRRKALASEREIVSEEIARLRAMVAEAHVEMRKFERLIELEAAREKAAADKRDAAELDEFATLRAGRQGA